MVDLCCRSVIWPELLGDADVVDLHLQLLVEAVLQLGVHPGLGIAHAVTPRRIPEFVRPPGPPRKLGRPCDSSMRAP